MLRNFASSQTRIHLVLALPVHALFVLMCSGLSLRVLTWAWNLACSASSVGSWAWVRLWPLRLGDEEKHREGLSFGREFWAGLGVGSVGLYSPALVARLIFSLTGSPLDHLHLVRAGGNLDARGRWWDCGRPFTSVSLLASPWLPTLC